MYVLFDNGSDYASGYSETIKPFTTGIRIDDVSMLKKEIEEEYFVDEKHGGVQWYVDKNGMPTTDAKNMKPLTKKIKVKETIDFAHYPDKFTKVDIMKHKQHILLLESKYDDCMMYEFNLVDFIDMNSSEKIQVNDSTIELYNGGFVKTKAIDVKDLKEFSIVIDSDDKIESYYSFDGIHYGKAKKDNKIVDEDVTELYLGFKNKQNSTATINAYHLLMKKEIS